MRRGRPPRLTREEIARAVLEIGFDGLTLTAVRERLDVGETTLFRYVRDRDELVRLALEYAVESIEWPSPAGPWREVLEAYALTAWRMWERHPGSATEFARGITPVGVLRLADDVCAMLIRSGFSVEGAVLACDLVFDLVNDHRRGVEHVDAMVSETASGRDHLHHLWTNAPLPEPAEGGATAEERSAIHDAMAAAIAASPLEWFRGKLAIVLDGIGRTLAPQG